MEWPNENSQSFPIENRHNTDSRVEYIEREKQTRESLRCVCVRFFLSRNLIFTRLRNYGKRISLEEQTFDEK